LYRDDTCAVCGESLPPDHFYCREHAATVDERLHQIGRLLPQVAADVQQLGRLLDGIAQETWDYLAEQEPDDPEWPPRPEILLRPDAEDISVDVDNDPGYVAVQLTAPLPDVLQALAAALTPQRWSVFADAAAGAAGLNATH
jgi:hypothetical protein